MTWIEILLLGSVSLMVLGAVAPNRAAGVAVMAIGFGGLAALIWVYGAELLTDLVPW